MGAEDTYKNPYKPYKPLLEIPPTPENPDGLRLNLVCTARGTIHAEGYANVTEWEGVKYKHESEHPEYVAPTSIFSLIRADSHPQSDEQVAKLRDFSKAIDKLKNTKSMYPLDLSGISETAKGTIYYQIDDTYRLEWIDGERVINRTWHRIGASPHWGMDIADIRRAEDEIEYIINMG